MIKNILIFLLSGVIMVSCTACGPSEIKRTFFVESMGVDWEDGQYLLTVQVFDPYVGPSTVGEMTEPVTSILTAKGMSLSECMVGLVRQMGRRPFFSQTQVVVLGEALARQGISSALNLLERDYDCLLYTSPVPWCFEPEPYQIPTELPLSSGFCFPYSFSHPLLVCTGLETVMPSNDWRKSFSKNPSKAEAFGRVFRNQTSLTSLQKTYSRCTDPW